MQEITNGKRLELALKKKGVKKTELAERMNVSRQNVNNWTAYSRFSFSKLSEILKVINMTHSTFFSLKDDDL